MVWSIGRVGADDHLRALAGRRKARRFGLAGLLGCFLRFVELQPQPAHGAADRAHVLFRREFREAVFRGHLDIDGEAVGIFAGFRDQRLVGLGNCLEMDVAAEMMLLAQLARHADHLLHRVVGAADDAGGEEQALDVIAAVEVERELDDLIDGEARPRHVAGGAVDAIEAIVIAGIGEQHLQQRDAASVRRVGMADAHAGRGRAEALAVAGIPLLGAAGGAGGVVLGGVGQDFQLALHVHH